MISVPPGNCTVPEPTHPDACDIERLAELIRAPELPSLTVLRVNARALLATLIVTVPP